MKRLTAFVVVATITILYWVPARGERSSDSGNSGSGGGVRLPDPKPYIYDACGSKPIGYMGCIESHKDKYWYVTASGKRDGVIHHTCRRSDGKNNGNKYPCVYYRDGSYLVYPVDIY